MAKLIMFSVYDGKAQCFSRPFFEKNVAGAMRSWEEACKEPSSPFCKYPSDFVLYQIGEFDEDTGKFEDFQPVRMLSAALDFSSSSKSELKSVSQA